MENMPGYSHLQKQVYKSEFLPLSTILRESDLLGMQAISIV